MDAELINRAAPPGSMRYLACLYAPQEARSRVQAMYLIEAEVREAATSASHDVAHTKLRWWREEIERLVHGRAQHPATRELAQASTHIDWGLLQQLIFAGEIELSRLAFDSETELQTYLERSGGVVHELIAQLSSATTLDAETRTHVRALGASIRHAEVLRDIRREAHAGRLYIPVDLLQRTDVTHEALSAREPTPAVRDLVCSRAMHALESLRAARQALASPFTSSLRPVLVMSALHERLLERMAAGRFDRDAQPGNFQRVWIAWRAALKAR
jgi:phytoene synthase